MKKLLLAIPAVVLFVPACGQAVGVDMPAESYTPLPTAGPSTPPPIVLAVEPVDPPVETAEPQGDEFVVTYVIDGDTIEVNTGERVRLIGIDTLEEGECGFEEASQRMEKLTLGETVTLTPGAQDDVDRYGRLLRYVDVGEVDAGEVMLREGVAIPRYNSTDGYGHHPREELYFGVSDLDGFAELLVSCGATWPEPNDVPAPDAPVDRRWTAQTSVGLSIQAAAIRMAWTVAATGSGARSIDETGFGPSAGYWHTRADESKLERFDQAAAPGTG